MLSDEERAAIQGDLSDEASEEATDEHEEQEGQETGEEAEAKEADEGDKAEDEEEAEVGESEEQADGDKPTVPDEVVEPKSDAFIPQLSEEGISEEEYNEQIEELAKAYEEGDITLAEYTRKTGELAALKATAEMNRINNERLAEQRWEADKAAFFELNPAFKEENDPDLYDALDAKLRRMAAAGELDGMTGAQALVAAAQKVVESRSALLSQTPKPAPENKRPRPKKPDVEAPQTLADVPAAQENEATKSKFAYLDELTGEELEEAVAKMSEADRLAYEKLL